jgi:hypothetical protein
LGAGAVIQFNVSIDKKKIGEIEKQIKRNLVSNESFKHWVINVINKSISIQKWKSFLISEQFRGDFGIDSGGARRMERALDDEINNVYIEAGKDGVTVRALDEDMLRMKMGHVWTNSKGRRILVNAWDAYEYGKIGINTRGRIFGYHVSKVKTPQQRRYSRSGISIMKPGGSFSLNKGAVPGIGAVRLDMAANVQIIVKNAGKIIKGKIK